MTRVGLIDNLQLIDHLVLNEGYTAPVSRYMAAVGGNTGNLAFVHGTKKCIGDKLVRVGWGWQTEHVHAQADTLVISCANQIGKHVDLASWADALARIDLPVVLIGLGAQTPNYEDKVEIPEGTLRFLDEVKKRNPGSGTNIAVRGEFTRAVLAEAGVESEAIGCPSLYISAEKNLGRSIARRAGTVDIERIAVAAGNPYHAENSKVEQKMIELCDRSCGAYVVQHPDIVVELALHGTAGDTKKLEMVAEALGFEGGEQCAAWFSRNAYSFHDPHVWMHFLRHYDAVIGARYHGVAFGVQAGVPGLTVHIDNRTRELSETTMIPSLGVQDVQSMDADQIARAAVDAWTEEHGIQFDTNRHERATRMTTFLAGNGIAPSEQLLALADQKKIL